MNVLPAVPAGQQPAAAPIAHTDGPDPSWRGSTVAVGELRVPLVKRLLGTDEAVEFRAGTQVGAATGYATLDDAVSAVSELTRGDRPDAVILNKMYSDVLARPDARVTGKRFFAHALEAVEPGGHGSPGPVTALREMDFARSRAGTRVQGAPDTERLVDGDFTMVLRPYNI